MAVTLRLKRTGRRNYACFRVAAFEKRAARDSACIEELGFYQPGTKDPSKQLKLNKERIEYWLGVGARCSETVGQLLEREGIARPAAQAGAGA